MPPEQSCSRGPMHLRRKADAPVPVARRRPLSCAVPGGSGQRHGRAAEG
jgi:hypothetical protein